MNANDSQAVRWTGGRVAALVSGIVLALIGLVLLVGGIGLLIVHGATRDDDGSRPTSTQPPGDQGARTDRQGHRPSSSDAVSSMPEGLLGRVRVGRSGPPGSPCWWT